MVIDCPAGIEHGFKNAIAGAEQAIVVTTPEVSAVRDADRIIGLLEAAGITEPKLIINRIRTNMVRTGDMMGVDNILDILAIGLLGIVPDDDAIVISTNRGEPTVFDDNSRPGRAFRNIARRIEGEDVPLMNLEEKTGLLRPAQTYAQSGLQDVVMNIVSFLGKFFGRDSEADASKSVAKQRLRLVLVHDRLDVSQDHHE